MSSLKQYQNIESKEVISEVNNITISRYKGSGKDFIDITVEEGVNMKVTEEQYNSIFILLKKVMIIQK